MSICIAAHRAGRDERVGEVERAEPATGPHERRRWRRRRHRRAWSRRPATDAPQLPGFDAAGVGAPPSTSMPRFWRSATTCLVGIVVATPRADGVRAVGVDDERRLPATGRAVRRAERDHAAVEVAPLEAAVERRRPGTAAGPGATWPPHGEPSGSPVPGTTTGRASSGSIHATNAPPASTRCRAPAARAPGGPAGCPGDRAARAPARRSGTRSPAAGGGGRRRRRGMTATTGSEEPRGERRMGPSVLPLADVPVTQSSDLAGVALPSRARGA